MRIDMDEVQEFYIEAMLAGFLGNAPRRPVLGKPDFLQIEIERGQYRLLDEYQKTQGSTYSFGSIMIWSSDVPVWGMSFSGHYSKEARRVVKAAMRAALEKGMFVGGRGLQDFSLNGLRYTNQFGRWDFRDFDGNESVYDHTNLLSHGRQRYHGHAVRPVNT